MFPPAIRSESDTLVGYIASQLAAIRTAAHGLTEEQARQTPCRSALSIGGIIKHTAWVMQGWSRRKGEVGPATPEEFQARAGEFLGSFALAADESLEGVLTEFDRVREGYLAAVTATDPASEVLDPPAPWQGRWDPTPTSARYGIVHQIEEFARHAGHADIIREQIDGAQALSLELAVDGREGNDFVQPWRPTE